jgi:hypothetical protein
MARRTDGFAVFAGKTTASSPPELPVSSSFRVLEAKVHHVGVLGQALRRPTLVSSDRDL